MGDDDRMSTFSYDGDGEPDSFNLTELQSVIDLHFLTSCKLEKMAEGDHHKVYDILGSDGAPLNAVVRVASPAFPKDKLESEVATCKMIAAFTNTPVPRIYAWNSDVSNLVGAEFIMSRTLASHNSGNLSEKVKKTVVSQIARYFSEIFSLRFESAGSLYLSSLLPQFQVGPIISTPFYRALEFPDIRISENVDPNTGPFSTRSVVLSELHAYDPTQLAESRLELGERVMRKAIELCSVYPLGDFRLSNVMIDADSGRVTGLIDFEAVTIAPLWECAVIPRWLQDANDPESSYEGGTKWKEAYDMGRPFRRPTDMLCFQVNVWASNDRNIWADELLEWAKAHPGIGLPETDRSQINTSY
ncbi:hypothetical protein BDR07DRAFT_1609037 [Suillus spraguei]|nr:hypothetical protein BDR07DRAFT_1609037 [Suillus spraguei]